jgi:hypothetical protein
MESPQITARAGLMTPADSDVWWGLLKQCPQAVFYFPNYAKGLLQPMENVKEAPVVMEGNHRRVITSALVHLDHALVQFENLANGHEIRSLLNELRNNLPPKQRKGLSEEIAVFREMLAELHERFGFERKIDATAHMVQTHCSILWVNMVELNFQRDLKLATEHKAAS